MKKATKEIRVVLPIALYEKLARLSEMNCMSISDLLSFLFDTAPEPRK